jgi:hypothetical protein
VTTVQPRSARTRAPSPVRIAEQTQQYVFGANVIVAEPQCLADGQLQQLLGLRREPDDGTRPNWPTKASYST